MLRKIYGPIKLEYGTFRMKYKYKLTYWKAICNSIYKRSKNKITWGYNEAKATKQALTRTPVGARNRGHPRKRWLKSDANAELF